MNKIKASRNFPAGFSLYISRMRFFANRSGEFAKIHCQELVILCFNLGISSGGWLQTGKPQNPFLPTTICPAVRALPDAVAVTREDELVLYVFRLAITLPHDASRFGQQPSQSLAAISSEPLFTSFLCHAWIHIGPSLLTIGSSFGFFSVSLDSTALQILEPQLSVLPSRYSCSSKILAICTKPVAIDLAFAKWYIYLRACDSPANASWRFFFCFVPNS